MPTMIRSDAAPQPATLGFDDPQQTAAPESYPADSEWKLCSDQPIYSMYGIFIIVYELKLSTTTDQ